MDSDTLFPVPRRDPALSLQWQCTSYKVMKCTHHWCIKNFSFCTLQSGEKLESPVFHMGPNSELGFRMNLYPKGISTYDYGSRKECISVFVGLISTKLKDYFVPTKFTITFLNAEGKEIKSLSCKKPFEVGLFRGWCEYLDRKTLFKPSNDYFPADQLHIRCEITAAVDEVLLDKLDPLQFLQIPKCTLSEDMVALYKSQKFCDLKIDVRGKVFQVHKAVLTARSPVFAAMLQHDMIEKTCGTVKITDFDAEVIEVMLQFMYSGDINLVDVQMAKELLRASDKYGMESMKRICESQLCKMINVDTVLKLLSLAEKYGAQKLKSNCLQFVACFSDQILKQENQTLYPELQPLILDHFVKAMACPSGSDTDTD